jgi:hypothetical protein
MNLKCEKCGDSFEPLGEETTCTWCMANTNSWTCTHIAWFLLCPIYLAELDTDCPVPIARFNILEWWLDKQFTLNDWICWVIGWFYPEAVGFIFYHVYKLEKPITITVHKQNSR